VAAPELPPKAYNVTASFYLKTSNDLKFCCFAPLEEAVMPAQMPIIPMTTEVSMAVLTP